MELPGIVYKDSNGIAMNEKYPIVEKLDELPLNNLSLLSPDTKYKFVMVQTSRGCPMRCNFCANSAIPTNRYRVKSPNRVIEEILHFLR